MTGDPQAGQHGRRRAVTDGAKGGLCPSRGSACAPRCGRDHATPRTAGQALAE